MHSLLGLFVALLFFIEVPLLNAQTVSPVDEEELVENAKDWWDVYCVYLRLGSKADGIVAAAFLEKISSLLADKWELTNQLREMGTKDRQFLRFATTLLSSEAYSLERATRIRENATTKCSPKNAQLCKNIRQAVDKLLKPAPSAGK